LLRVTKLLPKPLLKKRKIMIVSYEIRQGDQENNDIYGMNLFRKPLPNALISFVPILMSFDTYLKPK
jgi:hypothetical protein